MAEINAISALIAAITDDSERAFELGRAAEASMAPALPWVKRYAQTAQFFGLMYKGRFEEIRRIWDVARAKVEQRHERNYSDMLRDAMYGLAALAVRRTARSKADFRGDVPARRRNVRSLISRCGRGRWLPCINLL